MKLCKLLSPSTPLPAQAMTESTESEGSQPTNLFLTGAVPQVEQPGQEPVNGVPGAEEGTAAAGEGRSGVEKLSFKGCNIAEHHTTDVLKTALQYKDTKFWEWGNKKKVLTEILVLLNKPQTEVFAGRLVFSTSRRSGGRLRRRLKGS